MLKRPLFCLRLLLVLFAIKKSASLNDNKKENENKTKVHDTPHVTTADGRQYHFYYDVPYVTPATACSIMEKKKVITLYP